MSFSSKPKRGFTLIELMISISIMAILFTIGITTYRRSEVSGRDAKRKQDIQLIAQALELYYQTNKRYPITDNTGGTGYWQYSNNSVPTGSSFWLADKGNASGTPSVPAIDFSSQYTTGVSSDPTNKSPYVYAYYSRPYNYNLCPSGKYFILHATLENQNDNDLFGKSPYTACGESIGNLSYLNTKYVIIGGIN